MREFQIGVDEGARGSSSRSASAVSKSSLLFVRAEKSARDWNCLPQLALEYT